jgi:hypothetical protein
MGTKKNSGSKNSKNLDPLCTKSDKTPWRRKLPNGKKNGEMHSYKPQLIQTIKGRCLLKGCQ